MLQHEEATRIHLSFDADGTFQQVFESMSAEEQQPHAQSWIDGLDQEMDKMTRGTDVYKLSLHNLRRLCCRAGLIPKACHIPGTVVLEVPHPVSQGGYSDVYRGTYGGCPVAVKALRVHLSERDRLMKAFCSEVVCWKQLVHPNIVPFWGVSDMFPVCLVSPWMENGCIDAYIQRNPARDRTTWIVDVTEGLWYIHNMGMVHGDLKGTNVLLNDDLRACLADFGLSRMVDTAGGLSGGFMLNGVSLRWAAPETIYDVVNPENMRPTVRSDVYSLASVWWEITAGQKPFAELHNDLQVLTARYHGCTLDQPELCSDELFDLMRECWLLDSHLRPTTGVLLEKINRLCQMGALSRPRHFITPPATAALVTKQGSLNHPPALHEDSHMFSISSPRTSIARMRTVSILDQVFSEGTPHLQASPDPVTAATVSSSLTLSDDEEERMQVVELLSAECSTVDSPTSTGLGVDTEGVSESAADDSDRESSLDSPMTDDPVVGAHAHPLRQHNSSAPSAPARQSAMDDTYPHLPRQRKPRFIIANPDKSSDEDEVTPGPFRRAPPRLTTGVDREQSYPRSNPPLSSPSSESSPMESTPPPSTPGMSGSSDLAEFARRDRAPSPGRPLDEPLPRAREVPLTRRRLPPIAAGPPSVHGSTPSEPGRPLPSPVAPSESASTLRPGKLMILVTPDSETLYKVEITGCSPAAIREKIFTKLHIRDEDQAYYSIYRTEVEFAIGEALGPEQLWALCQTEGDAKGSLQFLVTHSSAPESDGATFAPVPAKKGRVRQAAKPAPAPLLPATADATPRGQARDATPRGLAYASAMRDSVLFDSAPLGMGDALEFFGARGARGTRGLDALRAQPSNESLPAARAPPAPVAPPRPAFAHATSSGWSSGMLTNRTFASSPSGHVNPPEFRDSMLPSMSTSSGRGSSPAPSSAPPVPGRQFAPRRPERTASASSLPSASEHSHLSELSSPPRSPPPLDAPDDLERFRDLFYAAPDGAGFFPGAPAGFPRASGASAAPLPPPPPPSSAFHARQRRTASAGVSTLAGELHADLADLRVAWGSTRTFGTDGDASPRASLRTSLDGADADAVAVAAADARRIRFTCDVCTKPFTTSHHLNRHLHTHETQGTMAVGDERTVWVDVAAPPLRAGEVPVDLDRASAIFAQLSVCEEV